MADNEISGLGPLGCATCPKTCCKAWRTGEKAITVFRGEKDTDLQGPFIQEMRVDNGGCKFLKDGNMCGIFHDPLRYITCDAYPFTIDEMDRLYISSTCESLDKLLKGITNRDPEIVAYVRRNWESLKKRADHRVKKFWGKQAKQQRTLVIEVTRNLFV